MPILLKRYEIKSEMAELPGIVCGRLKVLRAC